MSKALDVNWNENGKIEFKKIERTKGKHKKGLYSGKTVTWVLREDGKISLKRSVVKGAKRIE